MPTRAELPGRNGQMGMFAFHPETSRSWTDDLPVCHLSAVGLSTNQIYREDGQRREEHECEDRSFHFKYDENTYFYGIFDGHEGSRAANFAAQHMPAEVLLGQLKGNATDKEVKEVLHQAFIAVEKGFFESIGDQLAEKTNLQIELPEGLSSYENYQKYPDLVNKLQQINVEVSGGTTAVVALIYNSRLYVANVGDSRALLCRPDKEELLKVTQLSVDHDLRNEDELLRLSQLGLDIEKVRQSSKLGNQHNTRCIGNYTLKGDYKDFDLLKDAIGEPITAEPEVHGGIPVDDSFCFLLLMSDGLYKTLEEATGTKEVNKDIALMVAEQFAEQSTLTGVAQAVVDRVVRLHHDRYMDGTDDFQKRDDITLLVRNFKYQLGGTSPRVHFNPTVSMHSPMPVMRYVIPSDDPSLFSTANNASPSDKTTSSEESTDESSVGTTVTASTAPTSKSSQNTSSTDSEERNRFLEHQTNQLPLDEEGRIEPYVDFSDFYKAIEEEKNQTILGINGNK